MKEKTIEAIGILIIFAVLLVVAYYYIDYALPEQYVVLEQVWQSGKDNHQIVRVIVHDGENQEIFSPEWWEENKSKFKRNQINTEWVPFE